MERLTTKTINGYTIYEEKTNNQFKPTNMDYAIRKLGRHEDIEDDIGCPLVVLYTLLKRNEIDVWQNNKWTLNIPIKHIDIKAGAVICEGNKVYKLCDYETIWRV